MLHVLRTCSGCGSFEREKERRTLVRSGGKPDAPAVSGHDTVDDGEADTRALELARAVQALEDLEQLARVLHVEADTVVANGVDDLPRVVPRREDLYFGVVALARVLERVTEEIRENLLREGGVG